VVPADQCGVSDDFHLLLGGWGSHASKQQRVIRLLVLTVVAVLGLVPTAPYAQPVAGYETKICQNCPSVVGVPPPPKGLRPILFVATFELTWAEYLQSVDDHSCQVPNPNAAPQKEAANDILKALPLYRVDWPVEQLGRSDVECYINWLQKRTDLIVALPTSAEWEWFASSGDPKRLYPWGGQLDRTREALPGSPYDETRRYPNGLARAFETPHLKYNKVGQFPPSEWGLYDLLGNAIELTSDMGPFGASNPGTGSVTGASGSAVFKGVLFDQHLATGLKTSITTPVFGDRFGVWGGVRLVLIERK
jgi:Sulfatase-modifying factor enzyme 1